jgi:hypothetical protein
LRQLPFPEKCQETAKFSVIFSVDTGVLFIYFELGLTKTLNQQQLFLLCSTIHVIIPQIFRNTVSLCLQEKSIRQIHFSCTVPLPRDILIFETFHEFAALREEPK